MQALALRAMLVRAGHYVCRVVVSRGGSEILPAFFVDQVRAPITYMDGVRFVIGDSSRSINWADTLSYNHRRLHKLNAGFKIIDAQIRREKPDVVINFYEPLCGLYARRFGLSVPVVAIAHQFMFLHPQYAFPPGFHVQRRATAFFTRIVGLGATRLLGLSLREMEGHRSLHVVPPILRDELFMLPFGLAERFLLLYLYHHSCKDAVIRWHENHPDVTLHCFWNSPEAPATLHYDDTLTFHPLHGKRFLDMMSRCQGLVTTSGFESMAEAMYLGKPLMLIPTRKHFEHHCNGADGVAEGAAIRAGEFELDQLLEFIPRYRYDASRFRAWVHRAEDVFVRQIEGAVEDFHEK